MNLAETTTKTKVSAKFKTEVVKVLLALLLFVVVYIILFSLSLGAAIGFTILGILLIMMKPMFFTVIIGAGISVIGILIFIFIIKFIFHRAPKVSNAEIELKAADQPELHNFINEIARTTGTMKPKKIILYPDVNAGVHFDSTFLSMFWPVGKNLSIGAGLISSVNISEFKAIIAHEFGHFSQKSMRMGSFVYNFNKIIYNLLYENEGYHKIMEKVASSHRYLGLFVKVSVNIVQSIQWLLQKVYIVLNKTNMSLSREMEHHADAVAASVAGSDHLINGLNRTEIGSICYDALTNYLEKLITENKKPENLYPLLSEFIKDYAQSNNYSLKNNLPVLTNNGIVSRINIKNQWASHPSLSDREKYMVNLELKEFESIDKSPWDLFQQPVALQQAMTGLLYKNVVFKENPVVISFEQFTAEYYSAKSENTYQPDYKGYYDNRPIRLNSEIKTLFKSSDRLSDIFTTEVLQLPLRLSVINADIETLKQLKEPGLNIKHFELDGKRISVKNADQVIKELEKEAALLDNQLLATDNGIIHHALTLAEKDSAVQMQEQLNFYQEISMLSNEFVQHYQKFYTILSPIYNETMPVERAKHIISKAKEVEPAIKNFIETHAGQYLQPESISSEDKQALDKYLKEDQTYFYYSRFDNEELDLMNKSISLFVNALYFAEFKAKKEWLAKQLEIIG